MTELLYMKDFDVEACNARIISLLPADEGRSDITLDQTCFYARGGGQNWDQGTICKTDATFKVEAVRLDEDGRVHHIGRIQDGLFKEGDQVACAVEHKRRLINTRLHSAGHVIDMAVDQLGLDWVGTKGQHYPDLSAVEYSGTWEADKAESLRAQIEERANKLITAGSHNAIRFMPVADMHTVCRHVPDNIPRHKPARVVLYGENFGIPCGGTHVKNIQQIGTVKIPKLKAKKGVIRLSYMVEGINN